MGVSQATALAPDSTKAKDSAASIFEILDSQPKIDSSNTEGETLATVTGNIDFEHVSFKYPTRPDIQIFRDLCLRIPSGKVKTILKHNLIQKVSPNFGLTACNSRILLSVCSSKNILSCRLLHWWVKVAAGSRQ